jgi:hypothetical protein
MKIGGVDPKTLPTEEVLVLPRGSSQIVFRAQGLPDMEEFNKLVPEPKVPGKLTPQGYEPMPNDPNYVAVLTEYNKRRLSYLVVKSLAPSDIEWDTVKIESPGTWGNWEADLKANSLSQVECNLVLRLVMEANSLDESKLKRAREFFLLGPKPALAQ